MCHQLSSRYYIDDGGFRFWLGNYKDYLYDPKANREAYNFWARNVRNRIGDAKTRDLLAPLEPPHPFGVKRPCLEYSYYEQFNRPNVELVDIKNNPIAGFTEKGIKLKDGTVHELDVICIATGFDVVTGESSCIANAAPQSSRCTNTLS